VQIGEQDLSEVRGPELGFLQLLDFDHELGGPYRLQIGNDPSPDTFVVGIGKSHARAGASLHHDIVAAMPQCECTRGRQAHAILLVFDLFWNAD